MKGQASRWPVVGVTLLAAVVRLAGLESKSFWFDECFTYMVALAPLKHSLDALLAAGIYSPLYFVLLRPVVVLFGMSEYALRFPSAALGVLAVPAIYCLASRLAGRGAGVAAALMLAVAPFHVWYSQDARMYTAVLFFSLAAVDRFVQLVRGQRKWAAFAVLSSLAYLMHYAALSLVYVQLAYLLPRLRHRRFLRRWAVAQALAFLPLVPWFVLYMIRGIRPAGLGWIPRPGWLALLYTLWNFVTASAGTASWLLPVLGLATTAVSIRGLWPWGDVQRLLVSWLGLPMGFLFLLSLHRPLYVDRYLIVSFPAYLLLLVLGIVTCRKALWRLAASAVVLAAMLWGLVRLHVDPYFAKEDWRGVTAAIEAELALGDIVVLQDDETLLATMVYRTREWPLIVLDPQESSAMLEDVAAQHPRVWLVWRSPHESNHRLSKSATFDVFAEASPPVRDWLITRRERVTLDLRFPGLSLVRVDVE